MSDLEDGWTTKEYPEEIYFYESKQLKKLKISEESWYKAQTVLDEKSKAKELIQFLRLSDDTEEIEVE